MNIATLLAASAMLAAPFARAEMLVSAAHPDVAAGAPLHLDLTILNSGDEPLVVDVPAPVHLRLETATAVSTLEFQPARSGQIVVPPREFISIALDGAIPQQAAGTVKLTPTGLEANEIALQVVPRAGEPNLMHPEPNLMHPVEAQPAQAPTTALVDKPPPLAVSVYEPMYVLVGGDGGLNAKFQISFRYRLFDNQGPLARQLPWIDDLYLSFSQTSLWDLGELSKPFTDSSYRPRLFYANYDLARLFDGQVKVGVETGIGHESNGKDGDASRSYNMLYMRPTFVVGDPEGLRAYVAPLLHNYIAESDNPDIDDYRGYVDWLFGIGSKGGLDFWATLRKGTRSDYGSIELNASYPLSKLSRGDLTGWLMLQYFSGYGESLLDYNRKLDSQLRLGISIAL
jgi:outer membrane phospholipase A